MSDQFQSLVKAILDDDRPRAKELLNQHATLATAGATKAGYQSSIAHWIYTGDSALHIAAAGYRVEIAKLLLESGADCGAARNHRNSQPLHYASDGYLESASWDAKRQVRIIEVLLKAGADIHARDKNGATPLHRAVRTRCAGAVKFLLTAGSDVTLQNKPGSTPFHLAVQNTGRGGSGAEKAKAAQRQIIEAFLEHGASPTLKDGKGKSVLEWARSRWLQEILTGDGNWRAAGRNAGSKPIENKNRKRK
jgi:ankyrin repeat protein